MVASLVYAFVSRKYDTVTQLYATSTGAHKATFDALHTTLNYANDLRMGLPRSSLVKRAQRFHSVFFFVYSLEVCSILTALRPRNVGRYVRLSGRRFFTFLETMSPLNRLEKQVLLLSFCFSIVHYVMACASKPLSLLHTQK